MTTARDLINDAFWCCGRIGTGQTASSEDIIRGLRALNSLLAQWRTERIYVQCLKEYSAPCVLDKIEYTVGVGGDIVVATGRPATIQQVYIRQTNLQTPVDVPVKLLDALEDYNRIAVKNVVGLATCAFYSADMPLGRLLLWPAPQAIYAVRIVITDPLQVFDDLESLYTLSAEYYDALMWSLAERVAAMYSIELTNSQMQIVRKTKKVITKLSVETPNMKLPLEVISGKGRYNVITGTYS